MEKSRATGSGLSGGKSCSSSCFPFVGGEAGHSLLGCIATISGVSKVGLKGGFQKSQM